MNHNGNIIIIVCKIQYLFLINVCVRCWFKNEDFWQGKWRITEQCKYALDKAEIEIPFPQMQVQVPETFS